MKKVLIIIFLFINHSLYAKGNVMEKIKEGLKEENIKVCISLINDVKIKKEATLKSTGISLYYDYKMIELEAKKRGITLPELKQKEAKALEAKGNYLDYVNSYFILSSKCAFTHVGLLLITKGEQKETLYKDLESHSKLIRLISTQLYKQKGISKEVLDSHINTINTLDNFYAGTMR